MCRKYAEFKPLMACSFRIYFSLKEKMELFWPKKLRPKSVAETVAVLC